MAALRRDDSKDGEKQKLLPSGLGSEPELETVNEKVKSSNNSSPSIKVHP
jgi:hypothetical protein